MTDRVEHWDGRTGTAVSEAHSLPAGPNCDEEWSIPVIWDGDNRAGFVTVKALKRTWIE